MSVETVETAPETAPKTRRRSPSYEFEELVGDFPSLRTLAAPTSKACERAWIAAFDEKPEMLEALLSDLIKQAYAKPGRIGQRPMPREEEVDLEALLYGDYAEEPLEIALPKLIKISERAFCMKIQMNRRTYQRMFMPEGSQRKYHPDIEVLRRIAKAVGKPPSYFVEYRQMAAQAAFVRLINDRPAIATRLYKDYLSVAKASPFVR
jgi:transcriptional regulator with XRE-family HTH domain